MKLLLTVIFSITITTLISTVFSQWTEERIAEFEKGLHEFTDDINNYVHKEGTYDDSKYNRKDAYKNAETYDFIVVGAGAAGAAVASRLSEVKKWKVLLLEAGDTENDYTRIPLMTETMKVSKRSWGYKSEPEEQSCLGMKNHQCLIETGKSVAGSTALNGMMYTRGNALDYDEWKGQGNPGWGYDDVLPYFKKSEKVKLEKYDLEFHFRNGTLYVEEPQYTQTLTWVFQKAAAEAGLKEVDYNGREQIGYRRTQVNTKHGVRSSSGGAFLDTDQNRSNLIIKPLSMVTKIIIDRRHKKATGVEYLRNDTLYVAEASKEVIVSAGAINSAQLLMLSGVGPKKTLDKFNIRCLADLPVGKKLKDHVGFIGLNYVFNENVIKKDNFSEHDKLVQYLKQGKGPLTTVGLESLAFVNVEDPSKKNPDIELVFVPYANAAGRDPKANVNDETYNDIWAPLLDKDTFTIMVSLLHPKSTGSVTIKSKDPLNFPVIRPNYFTDEEDHDINTILKGIRYAQKIVSTPEFQKIGARLSPHFIRACSKDNEYDSNGYWKCVARYVSVSFRHVMGTCSMGTRKENATVDSRLRVHGIDRLRVADAGIIPVTLAGHVSAPAMMIGEKAAAIIKEDWKEV